MTASIASLTAANALSAPIKKKRVLLVDTCRAKRDVRAETMRRLGMEVDCAADISEARCWWRPELYDLVLFHVEEETPHMHKFWDDIRSGAPSQQVAFLVGKPAYLAASPSQVPVVDDDRQGPAPLPAAFAQRGPAGVVQDWGILEACRRISAVRSVADARTRALRDRPLPPRDMSTGEPKRLIAELEISLEPSNAEPSREEMQ